jgi:hypothetical protein
MNSISKQALERVARIYKSNKEAGQAIGMHPRSFARLCRQHDLNGDRMRRDPFRARDDLRHRSCRRTAPLGLQRALTGYLDLRGRKRNALVCDKPTRAPCYSV